MLHLRVCFDPVSMKANRKGLGNGAMGIDHVTDGGRGRSRRDRKCTRGEEQMQHWQCSTGEQMREDRTETAQKRAEEAVQHRD